MKRKLLFTDKGKTVFRHLFRLVFLVPLVLLLLVLFPRILFTLIEKVVANPLYLLVFLFFGIGFFLATQRHKLAIKLVIFCLPFTQVPTLKFLLRWRVSEVIAWMLLPAHLAYLQKIIEKIPRPTTWVLISFVMYFLYTGLIGIVHAPFVEIKVTEALKYTISPFFRTLLETARGFAAVSLFLGLLLSVHTYSDLVRIIKIFSWAGAVAGAYGVYQASVLSFGWPLPLLPGTLFHEGYARPFGTFYEPTGLGSFTSVSLLFALYFVMRKITLSGVICFILNALGLFISLSRAGLAGLVAGMVVLLVGLVKEKGAKSLLPIVVAISLLLVTLWLGYTVALDIVGKDRVTFALSRHWFEISMEYRMEAYRQGLALIKEFPYGFGSGLFLFYGAGAPGGLRLLLEGGIIGTLCLAIMHLNSIRCLVHLWIHEFGDRLRFSVFVSASYTVATVISLNYVNVTDMWIWFVWTLPALVLSVRWKETKRANLR